MRRILSMALLLLMGQAQATFARSLSQPDTTAPANATLRVIMDSLRQQPTLKGVRIKLQDINFETSSAVLTSASAQYIDTIAAVLNKLPALILEIGGHTDNVGGTQRNQTLSQSRAQAVRSRLVGPPGMVAPKRVTFRGYGETKPIAANTSEGGRLLNRRVEMQFVGLDNALITKVYLRNGQVVRAALVYVNLRSVLYKTEENAPLLELPCTDVLRLVYADGRVQVPDCPPSSTTQTSSSITPVAPSVRRSSKLYLLTQFEARYMMGQSPGWTSKTLGYAHVLGFGGTAMVGYRLTDRFAVGVQTGYARWSTRVEYKESAGGPIVRQYHSEATQIPLFLCLPVYLTESVYLMPEGGINLLAINAGFENGREKFTGVQTGYGATLGYSTDRRKALWFDVGLVYRAHQKVAWDRQYGVPPMHYAGLKLGLGVSL
ncbi:OmpA family protein [uncultured Spirosoma sp.]|uniref:OmpA family protein n=1 Tax=uncultured Spirosoma sp. TaxID=278208 RepID=UPI00258D9D78|nr:OmpA family protein [uncultured Spirosoma sp.]